MGHISFWPMLKTLKFWEKIQRKVQRNTEALLNASTEVDLEVNPEKTKYMLMSHFKKTGKKHSI
jgi:hypothetical protein